MNIVLFRKHYRAKKKNDNLQNVIGFSLQL